MELFYFNTNVLICICGIVESLTGFISTVLTFRLARRYRIYYSSIFLLLSLYSGSALMTLLLAGKRGALVKVLFAASNFNEFLLPGILLFMISIYILGIIDRDREMKIVWTTHKVLMALHVVILVISLFNGMVYSISGDNIYVRGPYYYVAYIPEFIAILIMFTLLIKKKSEIPTTSRVLYIVYYLIPLVGAVLNIVFEEILIGTLAIMIETTLFMNNIILAQRKLLRAKELENASIKADLMLAKMQPHFIFNSLMSIEDLCYTDPEKAAQGIEDFAVYLRNNMDTISQKEWIPFSEELSHIEQYIKVEKTDPSRRFEVEYDLEEKDFMIPQLTLQPLVENAVKHGALTRTDGTGKVTICTRKDGSNTVITVSDNGIMTGSRTEEQKKHAGIAVDNIRRRLDIVCGGTLDVTRGRSGTSATIVIPGR